MNCGRNSEKHEAEEDPRDTCFTLYVRTSVFYLSSGSLHWNENAGYSLEGEVVQTLEVAVKCISKFRSGCNHFPIFAF